MRLRKLEIVGHGTSHPTPWCLIMGGVGLIGKKGANKQIKSAKTNKTNISSRLIYESVRENSCDERSELIKLTPESNDR